MRHFAPLRLLVVAAVLAVLVARYASMAKAEQGSPSTGAARPSSRLLIIAPKVLLPSLAEFVAYKATLFDTSLRPLEEVLAAGQGIDDAEKLKRFLYTERQERGLDFVLLVGDVDVLPVRYMTLDRQQESAFNYSFYPSDLYYSDLAKADGSFEDWNAARDSFHAQYFGEVRGEANKEGPINFDQIDYHPDIAVGRWPVSTPEEAARVADKSIRYERQVLAGDSPHLRRAALVAVSGWVDTRRWLDQQGRKLAGWEVEKRYFSRGRRVSQPPPPTREAIRGLFDRGTGLIVHTGHGQPDQWEQCFFMPDLDQIRNADTLPVVVSAGCSTAHFAPLPPYEPYVDVHGTEHRGTDRGERFNAPPPPPANYQARRFNPDGLGEELLKRNKNGAVAYIGCNTGSQPCGLVLVEGFVRSLAAAERPRLGACWSEAVEYYYENQQLATLRPTESWYPPSIFFQPMKFMLFGDPSLCLPPSDRELRPESRE